MLRSALRTVALFAFASLSLAACGSSGNGNNNTEADMAMAPLPPDMAYDPGPYPTENIGTQEGKTLSNITGMGFKLSLTQSDVSALTYEEFSIDVLRNDPRCKCIMLVESATWCGPCNAEQAVLIKAAKEDPSFCIFDLLVDGPSRGVRPTQQDVEAWGTNHQQNFPIIGGNKGTVLRVPRPDALPTNVAIKPSTMEILAIGAGLNGQGGLSIEDAKALCAQ